MLYKEINVERNYLLEMLTVDDAPCMCIYWTEELYL